MERQELWCHDCEHYVQFTLNLGLNGNHVLECPNCGHEHCRVVEDGRITDIRWDRRNGVPIHSVSSGTITVTLVSVMDTCTGSSFFLRSAWIDCTASDSATYFTQPTSPPVPRATG